MNGLKSQTNAKSPEPGNANGGLLGWFRRRQDSGSPARTKRLRAEEGAGGERTDGSIAMSPAEGPAGRRLAKAKSVLVIAADDPVSRVWVRELAEWGYTVEATTDGEAGLDKVFDIGYDAVLLDLEGPNITGTAALEEIRAEETFKNLFIGVFVRDRGAEKAQENAALAAGASRVFQRDGTSADALLNALKAALQQRVFQVQPRSRGAKPATPAETELPAAAGTPAPAAVEPTPPASRAATNLGRESEERLKGPKVSLRKILLIEDDETLAKIYRNHLEAGGFEVEVALDGATGFHDLHTIAPHALLVDLFLPGISGLDIIRKTRAQKRFEKLPIFVFSSAYSREAEAEAREAGASHFFDKSTARPGDVLRALNELFFPGQALPAPAAPPAPPAAAASTAAPATLTPAAAAAPASETLRDDALKNEIRDALLKDAPEIIRALRMRLGALVRAQANNEKESRDRHLLELHRRIHSLVGNAAIAGFIKVARLSSAVDALLREFQTRPDSINASSQRTLTQALDFLAQLFTTTNAAADVEDPGGAEKILVVDDEVISRRVLGHSLEKAKLKPTALDHPQAALDLLGKETFDLIFLDVEMPDMNGFELCKKLRELPQHARTPVIFVTALSGFDNRVKSSLSGGDDFIGKPFSYIELAVKALVFVLRGRSPAALAAAAALAAR